ncbi:MAG TPA: phosphatidylserine decarboxylase [Parafilimonas sp.]|nr:phosphatidylserine decarboxylase [Parafilimonas sp.]
MPAQQPSVKNLIELLQANQDLRSALETAIKEADEDDVKDVNQFYNFINAMLTHIPTDEQLNASTEKFWVILNKAPDDAIKKSDAFNNWITQFILSMGNYMDSTESAQEIESFIKNAKNKIDEYIMPPGGWLTYNQFMARHVKPGKRPIDERCNDDVIVSPTDSIYLGNWEIKNESTITVKGDTYNVNDLLAGSKYEEKFKGGIFTHCYLSVNDYHRYHVPVGGKIVEVKKIPGRTWTNEIKKITGETTVDDIGFQFNQTRGYIIIKTNNIGFVAVLPVGMGFVSSINFTVDEGTTLAKGDEFGFFAYGGSDIIMLFEKDAVKFNASKNKHYLQGEKIAKASNSDK